MSPEYRRGLDTYGIGKESMWAGTAKEVSADFVVGPNQVLIRHTHSLRTHHLLQCMRY